MSGLSPEAAERLERLHEQIEQAERQAVQAARVRDEITALRVDHSSPDGEVTVSVDSLGRLERLKFSHSALGMSADRLAELVLVTVRQARSMAGRQVMELSEDTFGKGTGLVEQMRDTYLLPDEETPTASKGPTSGGNMPGILRFPGS